jgi:Fe-S-cluster containining protein
MVWLNPWELACLAAASGEPVQRFSERYCEFGGIRLRFDGPGGWKGLPACRLYDPSRGCTLHGGRPLSCRLYPLGRERQGKAVRYLHQGTRFPCLDGCPEVRNLPEMSVADYLAGQHAVPGEIAQDSYLEVMQELADGAFVLLLESGLAASGDRRVLPRWRAMGSAHPRELVGCISGDWLSALIDPGLPHLLGDPAGFASAHFLQLQQRGQQAFASLSDTIQLGDASCALMALALHLGRSLGSSPEQLAQRWIITAKKHGALE